MALRSISRLVAHTCVVVALAGAASGCERVQMPHEIPGPEGCGKKDPATTGPSMLSVAQQNTKRNFGLPSIVEDNTHGGKTWTYFRQSGSVFGEKETAEMFAFDGRGLLVSQTTEIRRSVGK